VIDIYSRSIDTLEMPLNTYFWRNILLFRLDGLLNLS